MHILATDNETKLITRGRPLPKVICTSFATEGKDPWLTHWNEGLEQEMRGYLEDDEIIFVGQNIAYDFGTTAVTFPSLLPLIFNAYKNNRVTDISVRQQLWDIANGNTYANDRLQAYSLAGLANIAIDKKIGGKTGEDIWRLRYAELEHVPLEQWPQGAIDYPIEDAVTTLEIYDEQCLGQEDICGEFVKTYNFFALSLLQVRGMRTNPVAVADFEKLHRSTLVELQPELIAEGLIHVKKNGDTTKKQRPAQQRILEACEDRGISPPLTPAGKRDKQAGLPIELKHISTDKAACLISGDALMLERSKYITAEKMLSTYLPVVAAGINGPVTTRFHMAATGRTTSASPGPPAVGGNLQNAPRKGNLRECFYPRPGYVYLAADFSGAELHTLAQACQDLLGYSVLGELLLDGKDVHAFMGAHLIGTDYDEFMGLLANGDEEAENARQDAKAANFGFPGGMFEKTFMEAQIKQREKFWSYSDAKRLRDTWLKAFPEMEEYFALCKRELGPMNEFVVTMNRYGSKRLVDRFTQLANTRFQAGTAAGALDALNEVVRLAYVEPESALYGYRPCNFVHDEIIGEWPKNKPLHSAAMLLKSTMEEEFNYSCPDFPVSVEPVAMPYWAKKAKPVFNEEGELQVWE